MTDKNCMGVENDGQTIKISYVELHNLMLRWAVVVITVLTNGHVVLTRRTRSSIPTEAYYRDHLFLVEEISFFEI